MVWLFDNEVLRTENCANVVESVLSNDLNLLIIIINKDNGVPRD